VAISVRRVLRWLFPPHLPERGTPLRKEAMELATLAYCPRGRFCPYVERTLAKQRYRILTGRCAGRQVRSLGGYNQQCGQGLQRLRVTSEFAFTSEKVARSGLPLLRDSGILRGRADTSPS
jgi:hypothetical protein